MVDGMRGHANPTERPTVAPRQLTVDLVADDELDLTPDAAIVLARIIRARVEARSKSSSISCHNDAAHSTP